MKKQPGLLAKENKKDLVFSCHEEIVKAASLCRKCLLQEGRTNAVIFDGNTKAKLMLIGEAPGEQEDLQGIPFVGRSGKLLDQILIEAEINRKKEAYICNVVKCRPANNRAPVEAEAQACSEYLINQIKIINPKIIIFLGASAVKYVLKLKDPQITKLHGKWIESEIDYLKNRYLMPFYHPSYLLRNPSKEEGKPKWQALKAMKEIKKVLDKI